MPRRLVTLCVALSLVVSMSSMSTSAGAQNGGSSCLMLGWTGIDPGSSFPDTLGTLQNVDGTEIRSLDGVTGFGWSPDGTSLAWSEQTFVDNPGQLQLGDALGATIDRTLPGLASTEVVWSPAGDRLVGVGALGVRIVYRSGAVVDVWSEGGQASWSSDGAWLSWSSLDGVHVARADGSDARLVAPGPSNGSIWRPTTHQLLVPAPSLVIYDVDTSALIPFSVSPIDFATGFAWSPDGSALAWSASADGNQSPRIYVERFDGNPAEAISPAIPQDGDLTAARPFDTPTWSPDGATIAAAEFPGPWGDGFSFGRPTIRLLESARLSPGTLIGGPLGPEIPPALGIRMHSTLWSPDSQWLLVQLAGGFAAGQLVTIYEGIVVPLDGSGSHVVGSSYRFPGQMSWWPMIGVPGEGGACVLAADEAPSATATPPVATRPQFTG